MLVTGDIKIQGKKRIRNVKETYLKISKSQLK